MKPLAVIEKTASKIAPGRAPHFIEAHLVKALMIIESGGPVGRVKLSKTMGLGEGTIRTLTRHLEKEGLIKISRDGIVLTNSGKKLSLNLKSRISKETEVSKSSLTVGPFNVSILVKNAADSIRSGLEQRDAAIKVGALGATTLIFRRGKLNMPLMDEDVCRKAPAIHEVLISMLQPQENDVIIIGSADDKSAAELGAIVAALKTLKAVKG